MSGLLFIQDLAVVLLVAGAVGWLCQRLQLSVVVGYLAAGAIIGPYTPPFAFVSDLDRVQILAQLGLVFVIFSIGLNLSLSRLKRLGATVVIATAVGALVVLNGARLAGLSLGWSPQQSLFLAALLMVSSSAIISKVLDELNLSHEPPGQMALGVTVLEDVVAIVMLTFLTSMVQIGGGQAAPLMPTLGALGAFVVFIALSSLLLIPRLLARLQRTAQPEVRILVLAGLLLAIAWLAARTGYSLALGAFVLGAIVGSTRHKTDVERAFTGLRDLFGAVFFVAVGMLVDFRLLLEAWPMVLLVTALALILRPIACTCGFLVVGHTSRQAIQAGLCLAPLGEFSFVIAQLGVEAGAVPKSFYAVAVGASLLTSLLAPVMMRRSERWSARLEALEPARLREWLGFYHGWLQRLRDGANVSLLWRLTVKRVGQVLIHVLFISALLLFATPLQDWLGRQFGPTTAIPGGVPFLFWTGFGLLVLGPIIAVWRNMAALALILAESATAGSPRQRRLQPLLEAALRTAGSAILAVWLLALLPVGWSRPWVAVGVLAFLALAATLFWRHLIRLQSRLEFDLREQFRQASHAAASSAWATALPGNYQDWDVEINEVTIPGDTAHANRTLESLALRRDFACSVIGIDRQGYGILSPRADLPIFPLDRLLLFGRKADLDRAARFLGQLGSPAGPDAGFQDLTMETVIVPEGSPHSGRPLSSLDLPRQVGVQIGGIRRPNLMLTAPAGDQCFQDGDELLVLGSHEGVLRLRSLLAAANPGDGAPESPTPSRNPPL